MAHLVWDKGGDATLEALAGEIATIRSSIPSPPGSRLDGKLVDGTSIRVKIHASKKQDDGRFVLQGRMIDLTKQLRERLGYALVSPDPERP
ncbi:hypothetical protein BH09MYX1_BH09MYX1_39070 [soil metagenome]